MSDQRLVTEVQGRVLVITMTRPEKRNAIDGEMTAALDAALNQLDDDPELWAGVLTGGPLMFCAGTDMAKTSGTPTERGGIYGVVGRTRVKPLIAAVEGIAFGGGFEIAMACDMIIAASNARFALPEVKRGLVASSGALFRASRVLPINVAKQLLMSGAELSPLDGHRLGLINEVTDPGEALNGALRWAQMITANAPIAVQQSLQAVESIAAANDDDYWTISQDARSVNGSTEDAKEGVNAFFEKRSPEWTGR